MQEPQAITEQKPEKSVNDIAGMGGMTRNGQCYAPINLETKEGEIFATNEGIKIAAPKRKDKEPKTNQSPKKRRMNF